MTPKLKNITHVIFDVDGTIYEKSREYLPGHGSIEDAHEFFRYRTYTECQRLCEIKDEGSLIERVVADYKQNNQNNTLLEAIESFSPELKIFYRDLVKKHGSNGKVFANEFGTDSGFFARIVGQTDFEAILREDKQLQEMIRTLKEREYQLGILTTERYSTILKVMEIMKLTLGDFSMENGTEYPILCSENVEKKKPSLEGFQKIVEVTGAAPDQIVYVGDSLSKDIKPPLSMGINAVLVTWKGNSVHEREGYIEIPTIYDLKEVLL